MWRIEAKLFTSVGFSLLLDRCFVDFLSCCIPASNKNCFFLNERQVQMNFWTLWGAFRQKQPIGHVTFSLVRLTVRQTLSTRPNWSDNEDADGMRGNPVRRCTSHISLWCVQHATSLAGIGTKLAPTINLAISFFLESFFFFDQTCVHSSRIRWLVRFAPLYIYNINFSRTLMINCPARRLDYEGLVPA